jgi:hypothetical protein
VRSDREILEGAVEALSEQARKADELVNEAARAGVNGSHPLAIQAKLLRQELLRVKGDLERELETLVLDCTRCGLEVHWVAGQGIRAGHWAHREPAAHGDPVLGRRLR